MPVLWPMEPHTAAKHDILFEYLKAYYPILSRGFKGTDEILYVDGFAGPGRYTKGEQGSPILAARTALGWKTTFPTPIRIMTIEDDVERHEYLCGQLDALKTEFSERPDVRIDTPRQGKCEPILRETLRKAREEGKRFGPAFVFLDQFGWADVSMDLVAEVMAVPNCEAFVYLNHHDLIRFIAEADRDESRTRAFGSDRWKGVFSIPRADWSTFLRDLYISTLHERGVGYVLPFYMYDKNEVMKYWLFYCTKSLKGVEAMKRAMLTVDQTGNFHFSDKDDPSQTSFLSNYDDKALAADLTKAFSGRSLTCAAVHEHTLVKTRGILWRAACKLLEKATPPTLGVTGGKPKRRPGDFPETDWPTLRLHFR